MIEFEQKQRAFEAANALRENAKALIDSLQELVNLIDMEFGSEMKNLVGSIESQKIDPKDLERVRNLSHEEMEKFFSGKFIAPGLGLEISEIYVPPRGKTK